MPPCATRWWTSCASTPLDVYKRQGLENSINDIIDKQFGELYHYNTIVRDVYKRQFSRTARHRSSCGNTAPMSDTASSSVMPVFAAKRGAQSSIMASIVVSYVYSPCS